MKDHLIYSDEVYLKFIQDLNFYNNEFLALKSYLNLLIRRNQKTILI